MNRFHLPSFWIGAQGTLALLNLAVVPINPWSGLFAALCAFCAWTNYTKLRDAE